MNDAENNTTDICAVCRFCTYENGRCLVCHNEDSENYGVDIEYDKSQRWACKDFTRHKYKDLSLKDALRIETLSDGLKGTYYSHKLPDNDKEYAIIALVFKTNAALEEWKDANIRLFKEYMDMAITDGDFEEGEE